MKTTKKMIAASMLTVLSLSTGAWARESGEPQRILCKIKKQTLYFNGTAKEEIVKSARFMVKAGRDWDVSLATFKDKDPYIEVTLKADQQGELVLTVSEYSPTEPKKEHSVLGSKGGTLTEGPDAAIAFEITSKTSGSTISTQCYLDMDARDDAEQAKASRENGSNSFLRTTATPDSAAAAK